MLLGSSCIKVLTNVVFIYHSGTCSLLFWETDLQSASPRGLTGNRSRCSGNAGERDVLVPFEAPCAGGANPLPGAVRGDRRRRAGGGTPGASPGSPAPGRVGGGDLGPHARWRGALRPRGPRGERARLSPPGHVRAWPDLPAPPFRLAVEGASAQRWPRDDRRHRARPDSSPHLPVQGVCREPGGQGPVQRGDEQVSGRPPWRGGGGHAAAWRPRAEADRGGRGLRPSAAAHRRGGGRCAEETHPGQPGVPAAPRQPRALPWLSAPVGLSRA